MSITDLRGCSSAASEYAECSGESDMVCMCDGFDYSGAIRSCASDTLGYTMVGSSAWSEASAELSSICSSHKSVAAALCFDCIDSAVSAASCLDNADYECLCGSVLDTYMSTMASCLQSHTTGTTSCPDSNGEFHMMLSDRCQHFNQFSREFDGCTKCQVAVANSLGCSGHDDYRCLCTEEDYTIQLSSCIDATCFPQDQTLARDSYTSECQARALGLISATTTATDRREQATNTASADDSENVNYDEDSDGPDMESIVGIVAGVITGLVALVVAGYFIFRKRSMLFKSDKKMNFHTGKISKAWKSLLCSPKAPITPTSSNDLQPPYEISGFQRLQSSSATLPEISANNGSRNEMHEMECQQTFQRLYQEQDERQFSRNHAGVSSSNQNRRVSIAHTL